MDTKQVFRKKYLKLRSSISPDVRSVADAKISAKILNLPAFVQASTVCCYCSYRSEVSTRTIIEACITTGKSVYVPKVAGSLLHLHRITSLSECNLNPKHIPEPPSANPVIFPELIDLFIVPGLAYDVYMHRLGFGHGYYDRLLKNVAGHKVGLGFTDQLIYQLPHTPNDIPLDAVITDTITLCL